VNGKALQVGETDNPDCRQNDDDDKQSDEKSDLFLVRRWVPPVRHGVMLMQTGVICKLDL
jgi:hypothetical protein